MKKIFMATLVASAFAATPAMAATNTADFPITGTVTASCGAITGETLAFGEIGLNADGTLATNQSKTSSSQGVYCNGGAPTITVTSTNLLTAVAAPADAGSFTKTLHFTADVNFAGTHYLASASPQALGGATSGSMTVTTGNLTATAKPYAGAYTGLIQVTLTPGA